MRLLIHTMMFFLLMPFASVVADDVAAIQESEENETEFEGEDPDPEEFFYELVDLFEQYVEEATARLNCHFNVSTIIGSSSIEETTPNYYTYNPIVDLHDPATTPREICKESSKLLPFQMTIDLSIVDSWPIPSGRAIEVKVELKVDLYMNGTSGTYNNVTWNQLTYSYRREVMPLGPLAPTETSTHTLQISINMDSAFPDYHDGRLMLQITVFVEEQQYQHGQWNYVQTHTSRAVDPSIGIFNFRMFWI